VPLAPSWHARRGPLRAMALLPAGSLGAAAAAALSSPMTVIIKLLGRQERPEHVDPAWSALRILAVLARRDYPTMVVNSLRLHLVCTADGHPVTDSGTYYKLVDAGTHKLHPIQGAETLADVLGRLPAAAAASGLAALAPAAGSPPQRLFLHVTSIGAWQRYGPACAHSPLAMRCPALPCLALPCCGTPYPACSPIRG
jgi:hypothetical protein